MPAAVGHRRGHRASIHRGCAVFHTSKRRATPASTQPPHDPGSLLLPLKETAMRFCARGGLPTIWIFFFFTRHCSCTSLRFRGGVAFGASAAPGIIYLTVARQWTNCAVVIFQAMASSCKGYALYGAVRCSISTAKAAASRSDDRQTCLATNLRRRACHYSSTSSEI
jgi:hypothetical protein